MSGLAGRCRSVHAASTGPTLALAAELADIRVGTWVYAPPVRPAWTTAWEAHSLSVLSEGRFEMGIGVGRPGIEDQLRELGLPRRRLARDFRALRDVELALHVPVVGDAVAQFMTAPDTDPAALRAIESLAILPLTRRRQPRKSSGDGRRSASPTSSSAPAPPTRSPRPSLRWPDTEPSPSG